MSRVKRTKFLRRGQTTVETAILIGAAVMAFVTMSLYVQRAYQGYLYTNASAHGSGFDPKQGYLEMQELTTSWDPIKGKVVGPSFRHVQDLKSEQEGVTGTSPGGTKLGLSAGSIPGRILRSTVDSTLDWSVNRRACYGNPAPCEKGD